MVESTLPKGRYDMSFDCVGLLSKNGRIEMKAEQPKEY